MNSIVIFSARVAKDLIQKEYKLNNITQDNKNKLKTIFYFENNLDLRKYLAKEHNIIINEN